MRNTIAQIRRDLAAAQDEESSLLESQARTGQHEATDGLVEMIGERIVWLRERLAAATHA